MLKRLKFKNKNILAIFLVLLLANIVFYLFFISYLKIDLTTIVSLNDLGLLFSSILIFAFISSKLPMLRRFGDSSIYDLSYFLIMAILTLFISYYNTTINKYFGVGAFLDMFDIVAISLIFMILAIRLKVFKAMIAGDRSRKNQIYCMIIFSILGILASAPIAEYGTYANVRTMTILIGSMFGGPVVGIPSAIIASLFRLAIGGSTAVPCSLSTLICGIIGSLIFVLNDEHFLNSVKSAILMFLVVGFEMLLIFIMAPVDVSLLVVETTYLPMAFASVIGIILFKLVIKENEEAAKEKPKTEVELLKEKVEEQEKRITKLEEELTGK